MKILHIIKDLEPGGIQTFLLDIFNNPDLTSHQMALLVIGKGRLLKNFKASGCEIFQVKRKNIIDLKAIQDCKEVFRKFQPDIIHSHHALEILYSNFIAPSNVKKVHTHHAHPNIDTFKDKLVYQMFLSSYDRIIYPSEFLRKQYKDEKIKSIVVNHGVDRKRVVSNLNQEKAREKLNIPIDKTILGMAGSFYNNIRNQYFICEQLPEIFAKNQDVMMVFAGAGKSNYFQKNQYLQKCKAFCEENKIADKVVFLDNVEDISLFYKAIDIYVHASTNDTFALSVAEACINNLPVLINDLEVFLELYSSLENVSFFKTHHPNSFIEQVQSIIVEKKTRKNTAAFSLKDSIKQMYIGL